MPNSSVSVFEKRSVSPLSFLVFWLGLSLLLFFFLHRITANLSIEYIYFVSGCIIAALLEAALILLIISPLKHLWLTARESRTIWLIRFTLFVLCIAPLGAYLLLTFISWFALLLGMSFYDFPALLALRDEMIWLPEEMTSIELFAIAFISIITFMNAVILLLFLPRGITIKQSGCLSMLVVSLLVLLFFMFRVLPPLKSNLFDNEEKFQAHSRYLLTPGFSLFWFPVINVRNTPNKPADLELSKAQPQVEYLASISTIDDRPNIIVFLVESMRADIVGKTSDGTEITPNINRLAKQGYSFSKAYAQANETAFSLSTILSGAFPLRFATRAEFARASEINPTIFDILSDKYETAFFASSNQSYGMVSSFTQSRGVQTFFDLNNESCSTFGTQSKKCLEIFNLPKKDQGMLDDSQTAALGALWLNEKLADRSRPLFAVMFFASSHFPYDAGNEGSAPFQPNSLSESEAGQISFFQYPHKLRDKIVNRYYNSLHYLDKQIETVIAAVESTSQAKNTIFIITGDHGQLFLEHNAATHGGPLWEESIKVPLIISGSPLKAGANTEKPAMHVDIAPTILNLAQFPEYKGFQGVSLINSSLISKGERPIFSTSQGFGFENAAIVWPWKYLRDQKLLNDYLFNLESDPQEKMNLIGVNIERDKCMRNLLSRFYNSQLAYYKQPELSFELNPPQYLYAPPNCR